MAISVLLVDDHEVVRQGLRALLEGEPDLTLAGEAATGEQAVTALRTLRPDVVVLDLALPGMSGLEVTKQVASHYQETGVLILSIHADEAYVTEAFRSGARGYVLKEAPASELMNGVRAVGHGRHFISSALGTHALDSFLNAQEEEPPATAFSLLTRRELDVLRLVAEGMTSREIGLSLTIGTRTVETHRAHIMRKLSLRTHGDLVAFAVRHNLLTQRSTTLP